MPARKRVTKVTLEVHQFDETDKIVPDTKEEFSFNTFKAGEEHHITSVFFGDNSVNNILANYYQNYSGDMMAGKDNDMLNCTINCDFGSGPAPLTVTEETKLTPELVRQYWKYSGAPFMLMLT